MSIRILTGDCRDVLKTLADGSVHCVVTSPPYFGLRDYGTAAWDGGDANCDHRQQLGGEGERSAKQNTSAGTQSIAYRDACGKCGAVRIDSQIGLEQTPAAYVAQMVEVFREVRRVLRDDGTVWLNLGDSYSGNGGYSPDAPSNKAGSKQSTQPHALQGIRGGTGLRSKNLVGIPWRVAFALQDDGWYLRQDIIWSKPNPMPESITDRCTKAHEYIFLLSKSPRYFYDAAAIAEPVTFSTVERLSQTTLAQQEGSWRVPGKTNGSMKAVGRLGPNANSSLAMSGKSGVGDPSNGTRNRRSVWTIATQPYAEAHFATFPPALVKPCVLAGCPAGGTVLDPFGGAGTTALVADRLGRNAILIELNPAYAEMARSRLVRDAGMFAEVAAE